MSKREAEEVIGKEPPLPFLFDDTGEAYKYVGGGGGDIESNWRCSL